MEWAVERPAKGPLIIGIAIVALVIVGLVLAVLAFVPGNLPSSYFKLLDRNHDFKVSYGEWMAALQTKSYWMQREWDFHSMDCNSDQRLTWWEYRRVVFQGGALCGKNPDIATRPRAPDSFSDCDFDPQTGMQRCVLRSEDSLLIPPADPGQLLLLQCRNRRTTRCLPVFGSGDPTR